MTVGDMRDKPRIYNLQRGPQDGAMVTGMDVPETIYVGPECKGDRFAAWGRKPGKRFPCRYDRQPRHQTFKFTGYA